MVRGIFVEDVFKSFQYAILKPSPMNFNKNNKKIAQGVALGYAVLPHWGTDTYFLLSPLFRCVAPFFQCFELVVGNVADFESVLKQSVVVAQGVEVAVGAGKGINGAFESVGENGVKAQNIGAGGTQSLNGSEAASSCRYQTAFTIA